MVGTHRRVIAYPVILPGPSVTSLLVPSHPLTLYMNQATTAPGATKRSTTVFSRHLICARCVTNSKKNVLRSDYSKRICCDGLFLDQDGYCFHVEGLAEHIIGPDGFDLIPSE